MHIDNNGRYIFILGEGPTQGLKDTTLTAGKKYLINFTDSRKYFAKTCIILEQIYLLMAQKSLNLKQKTLKLSQRHYV